MAKKEYISTHFEPYAANSPFAGISPAELLNRSPRTLPLVDGKALAQSGNVVFSQLAPWQFQYAAGEMNVKRTFRNLSRLTMQLLANAGIEPPTPLLANFMTPAADSQKRYLTSFYLDQPEEWDDPYRFFRW